MPSNRGPQGSYSHGRVNNEGLRDRKEEVCPYTFHLSARNPLTRACCVNGLRLDDD